MQIGKIWNDDEERQLYDDFVSGKTIDELVIKNERNIGGIRTRLRRLGLIDKNDNRILPVPEFISYIEKRRNKASVRKKKINEIINDSKKEQPVQNEGCIPEKETQSNVFLATTLFEMGQMSRRLFNNLSILRIQDLRKNLAIKDSFFLAQPNFGRKSLLELKALQKRYSPDFKKNDPDMLIFSGKTEKIARQITSACKNYNFTQDDKQLLKLIHLLKNLNKEADQIGQTVKRHIFGNKPISSETWEFSNITAQEITDLIDQLFSEVSKIERDSNILKYRYGFIPNSPPLTLQSIGEIYSISRERARQIEKRGLRLLSRRIKKNLSLSVLKLKTIANALFKEDDRNHRKVIQFCLNFFDRDIAWRIAVILFVCIEIETLFPEAAQSAKNIIKQIDKELVQRYINERQKNRQNRVWEKFHEKVIQPTRPKKFGIHIPGINDRCREPNEDSIGNVGSFYSSKISKEVKYESNMEFFILSLLDSTEKICWYQEQPLKIPYTINNINHLYYPDIAAVTTDGLGIVIEVKGVKDMILTINLCKALAAIELLHGQGIGFLFVDARGKTLKDLTNIAVSKAIENDLLSIIDKNKIITYKEYKEFKKKNEISFGQFASIVIRNDLSHSRQPFRLSRLDKKLSFKPLLESF